MPTATLPPLIGLPPRADSCPTLAGHSGLECRQLDNWQATVPVLGWLFHTAPSADLGLLAELNRGRQEVRALSVLDVLAILVRAGGGGPELCARVRTLTNSQTK